MWIVKLALRRPYTFIVAAIAIVLLGLFMIVRTPVDIFPSINIPIIATVWGYAGLSPQDMASRMVANSERGSQNVVSDVEHMESQSLSGIAIVKYFFQPNVNLSLAYTQVTGVSQTLLRQAPPGTTPPVVIAFDASTVPVLQLTLQSDTLTESRLYDLGNTVVRIGLRGVAGAAIPYPYGGKSREIQVDLDPDKLRAKGLAAVDVSNAIAAQNLIIPAGTQRIGGEEYNVRLNSAPLNPDELNDVPVRTDNGIVTYVRDVAYVHDGSTIQTNIVRVNGRRSSFLQVSKNGNASTLAVIDQIKKTLPTIQQRLPPELKILPTGDQSLFVRAAINGVMREGIIAAALTGLMILLFLGSWRSTLIITISIPLSILASVTCLSWLGQTINIMTLGGLALAVGILVDDATVAIENINWHLEQGKDVETAILDGAQQIAVPALVSTLCICIVFVPMFLLSGVSKFLFVPLAEAVVFAMLASYVLSRTLVPTLAKYWLRLHEHDRVVVHRNPFGRIQQGFERRFKAFREGYHALLAAALTHRAAFVAAFMALGATSVLLLPWLGRDFFPSVDAGQMRLHIRAPSGTRIEQTASLCDSIEDVIRRVVPAAQLDNIVDNIGLPYSSINLMYSTSSPVGEGDADIMVSLKPGHRPTVDYIRILRRELREQFPGTTFAFLPADIVSQILNFGLPSPLDVQVVGNDADATRHFANKLMSRLQRIPGAVDLRVQQAGDFPELDVTVNRSNASQLGLTQKDVATNLLISLSGTAQAAPAYWVDPETLVQYAVETQTPPYRLKSIQDLANMPITASSGGHPQLLANLAGITRGLGPALVSHYDARPVIDIYGAVQDTDLGTVSDAITKVVADARHELPRGSDIMLRGQMETMRSSFRGLALGMIGAVILIYLLIVVNFQSWLDPFIIITALPAAMAGMVWMLFTTHTSISVPALIGAIMCLGVATANSILVVSFARERMSEGLSAAKAALEAGYVRFRPVLMTAAAMVIGMVPMALGLGEGGEQNAPLGRAVIGGLLFATFATLLFVPVVFALVHEFIGRHRLRESA
jgi:CzcA family heavy metal efflux pump